MDGVMDGHNQQDSRHDDYGQKNPGSQADFLA